MYRGKIFVRHDMKEQAKGKGPQKKPCLLTLYLRLLASPTEEVTVI